MIAFARSSTPVCQTWTCGTDDSSEVGEAATRGGEEKGKGEGVLPRPLLAIGHGTHFSLYDPSRGFTRVALQKLYFSPKTIAATGFTHGLSVRTGAAAKSGGATKAGYWVAVGGSDGVQVHTWPADPSVPCITLLRSYPICTLAYSTDGKYLAVAAVDGHLGVWHAPDLHTTGGAASAVWHGVLTGGRVTGMAFQPGSAALAIGCWDKNVSVLCRRHATAAPAPAPAAGVGAGAGSGVGDGAAAGGNVETEVVGHTSGDMGSTGSGTWTLASLDDMIVRKVTSGAASPDETPDTTHGISSGTHVAWTADGGRLLVCASGKRTLRAYHVFADGSEGPLRAVPQLAMSLPNYALGLATPHAHFATPTSTSCQWAAVLTSNRMGAFVEWSTCPLSARRVSTSATQVVASWCGTFPPPVRCASNVADCLSACAGDVVVFRSKTSSAPAALFVEWSHGNDGECTLAARLTASAHDR